MRSGGLGPLLDQGLADGIFAGAAAGTADTSRILEETYVGESRVEPPGERAAVSKETLFDLASLTKPLAGAALTLALAEDRLLSLDDPIDRFADLYKSTRFEGVTLRLLLAHIAGVPEWYPCYVRGEGRASYRKTIAGLESAARPGTAVIYSCIGYLLLAEAVERAAGETADRLFGFRVAAPLGLERDLLFSPAGADRARCAGGERGDATERDLTAGRGLVYTGFRTGLVNGEVNDGNAFRRGDGVSLNAGLFGTLRAVLEMGRAWLLQDPRLLEPASFAEATRVQTGEMGNAYGLGWQMGTAGNAAGPSLGAGSYGQTGFTGVSLFLDPTAGRVHALLTNRLHPDARKTDMNEFRRRFHSLAAAA